MTRPQRTVVIVYCLLVAYCGVWVPWHYDIGDLKGIKEGYALVWNGPPDGRGAPDMATVAARVLTATGLSAAAFLLADKWKALLLVVILAAVGILLYGYWTNRVAEHRIQKIHDCAVAKAAVATKMKCAPAGNAFEVCDPATPNEEDAALRAGEEECIAEINPKRKSAHQEIEEYRHQHGTETKSSAQWKDTSIAPRVAQLRQKLAAIEARPASTVDDYITNTMETQPIVDEGKGLTEKQMAMIVRFKQAYPNDTGDALAADYTMRLSEKDEQLLSLFTDEIECAKKLKGLPASARVAYYNANVLPIKDKEVQVVKEWFAIAKDAKANGVPLPAYADQASAR
jgi:hypothetical protein